MRTFQYDSKKNNLAHSLDDSDLVGDVQGVVVRGKADVGLLISSGSHQCVHLQDGMKLQGKIKACASENEFFGE